MTKAEAVHSLAMMATILREKTFDTPNEGPSLAGSRRVQAIEEASEILALADGEVTASWMFDQDKAKPA